MADTTDVEEREANLFAMALLMPRKWLLDDIDKMGGVDLEDEAAVGKLAKRYKVSITLMAIRLGQIMENVNALDDALEDMPRFQEHSAKADRVPA